MDPERTLTRVLADVYTRADGDGATAPPLDSDALRAAFGADAPTHVGGYDHGVGASGLFNASITSEILELCAGEMDAFGYTADDVEPEHMSFSLGARS